MDARRTFRRWFAGLAAALVALLALQGALFWIAHAAALARMPAGLRWQLLAFFAVAAASLLPFVWLALRGLFRRYVEPWQRLAEDAEAAAHGRPGTTLRLEPEELAAVGEALNRWRGQPPAGAPAAAEDALPGILRTLGAGVVLCGADGRVHAFNPAAGALLGNAGPLAAGAPVERWIDPPLMAYATETLRDQHRQDVERPHAHFVLERPRPVLVRVSPWLQGTHLAGWVLLLTEPVGVPEAGLDRQGPMVRLRDGREAGAPPDDAPLAGLRYVVLDTETTGLDPARDAVLALGAVTALAGPGGGRIVREAAFDRLVDPGRPITAAARRVHGISPEMVAGRAPLSAVLPEFCRFAEGAVWVAHNAAFDLRFLERAAAEAGLAPRPPVLDTLLLSAVVHPGQPSHALDALLLRYGIEPVGRHTALGDALLTAELLLRLLPQLQRRGITTLGEARRAQARTPLARVVF